MTSAAAGAADARIISYAQNAEDMVLRRVFGERADGFYIDVGANHPVTDSVTKHFYDKGWHGINIEPVASLHELLQRHRPRDVNLRVGIGAEAGLLEMGVVTSNEALSTFHTTLDTNNAAAGLAVERQSVQVMTLAAVCEAHVTGEIDFLKVDVEGFEEQVFAGNDWARFRPKVILAEDNFSDNWHPLLQSQGYTQTLHDGINRFYVRNDLLDTLGPLLSRPAVIATDGFDPWHYQSEILTLRRQIEAAGLTPDGGRVRFHRVRRVLRPLARSSWGLALRRRLRR